jgi:hypothetical protein
MRITKIEREILGQAEGNNSFSGPDMRADRRIRQQKQEQRQQPCKLQLPRLYQQQQNRGEAQTRITHSDTG